MFEDFSSTQMVDGFVLTKNKSVRLATLKSENGFSFVHVKSNQLPILDDFFKYAQHINTILNKEYIERAKEELLITETRFKDLNEYKDTTMLNILSIDRYIVKAEKEKKVFSIQHPTMPVKVSQSSLVILMSVVLSGIVGVLFILVRDAITKRKEQLAKE